jgi:gliding motility-associated-like protein
MLVGESNMRQLLYTKKCMLKAIALLAVIICSSEAVYSQAITNMGKEFWVGYGHHHFMEPNCDGSISGENGNNSMNMVLYLSNTSNVTATVTVTIDSSGSSPLNSGNWFRKTYQVLPNTVVETENIPKGVVGSVVPTDPSLNTNPNYDARLYTDPPPAGTGGEGIFRGKGIHIVSDIPIVAYAHIYGSVSSGATMLLPTEAWGYSYTSVNSEQNGNAAGCYSWMYAVAKEDSTFIEITPSATSRLNKPAWVPYQVMLMKGQIYQLIGQLIDCDNGIGVQLTGTKVRSISVNGSGCKPIAVFSGSSRTQGEVTICDNGTSGRDNDMQQCYPHHAWGKNYVTAPFSTDHNTLSKNVFKVAVKDPSTIVKRNGVRLGGAAPVRVVSIRSSYLPGDTLCPGEPLTFYAIPENAGANPIFEWTVNGGVINGNNSDTLTYSGFTNGSTVSCKVTSNLSCATGPLTPPGTSFPYSIKVKSRTVLDVEIFSSSESNCGSSPILFTAVTKNAGSSPTYEWWTGGHTISGANGDTYSMSSFTPGDSVYCVISSNAGCLANTTATSKPIYLTNSSAVTATVKVVASVDLSNIICSNTSITFTALSQNGGNNPTYQWKHKSIVDGITYNVGNPNSNVYTETTQVNPNNPQVASELNFGDEVWCELSSSAPCATPALVTSNKLTLFVGDIKPAQVQIYASSRSFCGNDPIIYKAQPFANGGTAPTYQWEYTNKGVYPETTSIVGTGDSYTLATPHMNDVMKCYMTSNAACVSLVATHSLKVEEPTGLINRSYYIYTSSTPDFIEADKPVQVAQYMTNAGSCSIGLGDPEMVFLSPIEQAIKKTIFYKTNRQSISLNYLTLLVPTGGLPSLYINNGKTYTASPHPNKPNYSVVIQSWPANLANKGQVIVQCDTGFNAVTYGLGGAESYAYNAGTMFINTNGLPANHNTPDTSSPATIHPYGFVGSPMKIRALVAYQPLSMTWQLSYLGCSVVSPCTDVTISNPVYTDIVIVGNATYYLYELPGTYLFSTPGTYYLPINLISPNFDNQACSSHETVTPEITIKHKPSIEFTTLQNDSCGVATMNFYANNITPQLYNIIKWKWQFTANDSSYEQNPHFLFPVAGVYPVKLSIITQHGGIADTTINVTVTSGNKPHSNFGAYPSTVCLGQPITFIDSTNRIETDYWYWDFGDGHKDTVNNNLDRQYTYTLPGTYLVKHAMMGSTFPCPPDTVSRTVIVATTPSISGVTPKSPTSCVNGTDGAIDVAGLLPNTPHDLSYVFNGNTYTVTATSNASGVATIPNLATGTYTNIIATIGNCSSTSAGPVTLVDPPAPAQPTATSNSPVCVNGSINLTASTTTTGTMVYNWTGPNSYTSTTQNPTIANATTAMSGTYSVTATLNGCVSAPQTVNVTVNALPNIGNSGVNSTQTCNTATGSIWLDGLVPNTAYIVKYTFNSVVTTVTITTDGTGLLTIGGLAAGTYSNVNVALGSCQSSAVGPFVITDPNPPATPTATSNSPICEGTTLNLSASSGLSNITYEWTGPNSFTSTVQNPSISTATLAAAGTYNVVVVNQSNCKSQPFAVVVQVKPLPSVPTVASNSPICGGANLTFTASSTAGSTYTWIGPNSFTSSVQNPTIAAASPAATGTYTVTANLNGCSVSNTTAATVNPVPVIGTTVTANPTSCASSTGSITLNGLLASTTYTVTYTSGSGLQTTTITSTTAGSVIIGTLPAGTYSNVAVMLTNCTSSAVGPFTLTDPAPPAKPTVTASTPICSGTALSLTASSATAGVTYAWTGPDAFASTTQNPTIANASMTAAGTYSVTATLNNCVSLVATTNPVVVKQTPSVTTPTANNPTNCATATGSIVLNGLTANTLYTVSYTKNGGSQTANITTDASGVLTISNLTAATYNNIVVTLNGCSSAAAGPFVLSDPSPPATPVASTNQVLCDGSTLNLTATSATAGVTYNWTGPNSFTSSVQNPSIANVTTAASGNYLVTATLNSCISPAGTTNVLVNATPVITGPAKSDPTSCGSSTGSITLNGLLASTSYTVNYTKNTVAQTATISSNASGSLVIPLLPAGVYANITVALGSCTSSAVGPFTLTDPAPPTALIASNNGPLCENSTLNLAASTTTSGAVTYAWTGPNSFTSAVQNPSVSSIATTATGTYTVTATLNNCSSTATTTVSVRPYPVVNFTTPTFVCMPNGTVNFTNQTTVPDNSTLTYVWDFGDASGTSTDVNASHVYGASTSYNVMLTATAGVCSKSTTKTFSAFYDKPIAAFKADKDTICQGVVTQFTDMSTAPNSTITNWAWNFGDGSAPSSLANPTKLYGVPNQYDVKLTVKNAQGCTSDVLVKSIRVYIQPKIDAGMSFIVPIGTTVVFTPTTNDSTTVTFAWTPAADFANPNVFRPTLVVTHNQTYKVTATGLGNCQATDTMSVVALQPFTIPNAFSPNGDGTNDKWDITNLRDYSFAIVEVFNRNGQSVYKSYGYNQPWDGTLNGKPLPVGVYYYILDFKGTFPRRSGYVTILR